MIVRVNKNKNFTVMSNVHLKDKRLTLKAKGLLSVVLALPDDWDYSIEGLTAISREKEGAINSALKELKNCGYLKITKKMPGETGSGRIEYEWDFYEIPKQGTKKQDLENQGLEIQGLEIQGFENHGQLNTNNKYIKEVNTKEKNIFLPPTVEEVYKYCEERHNGINAQLFVDYYTAKDWLISKNVKMKDWKATIRAWENNSKRQYWD